MLEKYNLETKHYVILAVLGVVELVLFALMFYNCFIEYRQKKRRRKYQPVVHEKPPDEEKGIQTSKISLMDIYTVDMTLKRDRDLPRRGTVIPSKNHYYATHGHAHRPSRHSF